VDNRLSKFKAAGYEFVEHNVEVGTRDVDSSNGTSSVVNKDVGKGVTAYLMRIDEEFYEEDQAAKQKTISDKEASMKRTLNSGDNGTYGSVKIE
jgi:hypothetical protein